MFVVPSNNKKIRKIKAENERSVVKKKNLANENPRKHFTHCLKNEDDSSVAKLYSTRSHVSKFLS